MAKTTKERVQCAGCGKSLKSRGFIVNGKDRFGPEGVAQVCDTCHELPIQCDLCQTITTYEDGAVFNQAANKCEDGDGVICPDCQDVKATADKGTLGESSPNIFEKSTAVKTAATVPPSAPENLWHAAGRWVVQPGNYAKLERWIEAGCPDDPAIPFKLTGGAQ